MNFPRGIDELPNMEDDVRPSLFVNSVSDLFSIP